MSWRPQHKILEMLDDAGRLDSIAFLEIFTSQRSCRLQAGAMLISLPERAQLAVEQIENRDSSTTPCSLDRPLQER